MQMNDLPVADISFKELLFPLTTLKAVVIITLIGFVVHGNTLFNGFVSDDYSFILDNKEVHSLDISRLIGQSYFNTSPYYRPIPATYFTLMYSVTGNHAFLYHLIQVGLHIVCAVLLFMVLRYTLANAASLTLAIIFLVHPINVEATAYITATTSQLFTIPGLLALLIIQRSSLTVRDYWYIAVLLLLSMLAKETGILFMLVGLVFAFLHRQKLLRKLTITAGLTLAFYGLIRLTILMISKLSLESFLLTSDQEWKIIPIANLSLFEKALNIPAVVVYYVKTFVYPTELVIAQIWVVSSSDYVGIFRSLLIVSAIFACLLAVGIYLRKTKYDAFKSYALFFIWFILGLMIHLPIVPLYYTVADHWFYFPIMGLLGMFGIASTVIIRNISRLRSVAPIFLTILIILFSLRTIIRNTNFADLKTLLSHDTRLQPNYMLEADLGQLYLAEGDATNSLIHLQNANRLQRSVHNLYVLGFWHEYYGNYPRAVEYYSEAYSLYKSKNTSPRQQLYERLSYTLIMEDDLNAADSMVDEGIKFFPKSDVLWQNIARIEYAKDNQTAALSAIKKAKSLKPLEEHDLIYEAMTDNKPLP
jgi:hypothetical protein